MKYKIGDKVWIKTLKKGNMYGDFNYHLGSEETCISGKLVEINGFWTGDEEGYNCSDYRGISPEMIDEEKTSTLNQSYEIY